MSRRAVRAIVPICLILLSLLGLFSPLPTISGVTQVLFSDNFASYPATATCNSVNDNCDAPPHIGNATNLPSYWIPASSGTCEQLGGCITWDDNVFMGPNSVFAVVTEEAASGTHKSLKLGASDYYADKTSAAVWLSPNDFPSGRPVSFKFEVWLSNGTDNPDCYCNPYGSGPDNAFVIQAPVGKLRYYGQAFLNGIDQLGVWEIQNDTAGDFAFLGDYHLTTQTWHTITVTFDWTNNHWNSLVIDGQQPFAAVKGYPTYQPLVYPGLTYVDFALFIDPFADNQSITSAQSYGFQPFYAYLDNVKISVQGVMTATSVTTTSTTATFFTTTVSPVSFTTATTGTSTAITTLPTVTSTSTVQTTSTTTTTGLAANTTTTTFTSTISTATTSSTTTLSTGRTTVQTSTIALSTLNSTTTAAATTLTTTTVGGTVFISQTNTYNVTVTSVIHALYQFAGEVLKLLGIQPINRPLIRVVNRVIVIKPP